MATSYKVLGQLSVILPGSDQDLYTVPAATQAVCSTLVVCNQGTSATFRVAIRKAGAVLTTDAYIVYDNFVNANDSIFLTLGISLAATDVITVRIGGGTAVSFNLFGAEIV